MQIVLEGVKLDVLTRLFDSMRRRSSDLSPVLGDIITDAEGIFKGVFSGDPDLIRTQALFDSLTRDDEQAVIEVDDDRAFRGTDVWYAAFHRDRLLGDFNEGTAHRWGAMIESYIVGGRVDASRAGMIFGL